MKQLHGWLQRLYDIDRRGWALKIKPAGATLFGLRSHKLEYVSKCDFANWESAAYRLSFYSWNQGS